MLGLRDVINEWNRRWRNMERLRVEQRRDRRYLYAQIGFTSPSRTERRSHYEFLQRETFAICFHKETGFDNRRDPRYQEFESLVRRIEPCIKRVMKNAGLNIDDEEIIDQSRRKYFWLNINFPCSVTDVGLVCDCMKELICATYHDFAVFLGERSMPEFDVIAGGQAHI